MSPAPPLSRAAAARRPLLAPPAALGALLAALAVAVIGLEALLAALLGARPASSLHVAVFFVAWDLATGLVLVITVARRLAADRAAAPPDPDAGAAVPVSILIAAYNEAGDGTAGAVGTIRALAAQQGVRLEILLGDDGSEDGTFDQVVQAFGLEAAVDGSRGATPGHGGTEVLVRAFRFGHAGKGATLNALAARASHDLLVTVDADTIPAPGAVARLAAAFADPDVELAAGVVSVQNATSLLTRHQHVEYVKNSVVRIGWSALGGLEQVPGAFAAVRARSFVAAGGFPVDSLTEDYELAYRLVAHGVATGRLPVIVTVPRAQAFTDVPVTFRGFVRQRTRWFAGFLSTLFRFRRLIGLRAAGGFGVVRLPLKLVDAVLPLLAFASLAAVATSVGSAVPSVSRAGLALLAVRWGWDLCFFAAAHRLARQLGDPELSAKAAPRPWHGWVCAATEVVSYVWLKHASVLRAYLWAAARVHRWEPSREEPLVAAPPTRPAPW